MWILRLFGFGKKKRKSKCTKYLIPEMREKKSATMKDTLEYLGELVEKKNKQVA